MAAAGGLLRSPLEGLIRKDDKLTPYEDVTGYNNFYEFGTDKDDPARNAGKLRTRPWKVDVAGEVKRPATYGFDELLKPFTPEERVILSAALKVGPW